MDPNANLAEQESILVEQGWPSYDWTRLTELRSALANWLSYQGFEPDWARYPVAAKYYKR